jgi:hypothetical protein
VFVVCLSGTDMVRVSVSPPPAPRHARHPRRSPHALKRVPRRPPQEGQRPMGHPNLDVRLTRSQSGSILDIDFVGGESPALK